MGSMALQMFRVAWRDEDGQHLTHMSQACILIAQKIGDKTVGKGVCI